MADTRTSQVGVQPRAGRGMLRTGIVLLVIGVVALVLGTVFTRNAVASLTGQVGSPQQTPATITRQLDALTTYAVYAASGSGPAVRAADVSVTSDSGFILTVTPSGDTVRVNAPDGKTYSEVATFDIGTSGTFTIKVASEGSTVTVAPALSTAAKGLAWIVAIGLGALLAFVGLVLAVIGAVRRSAARRSAGA